MDDTSDSFGHDFESLYQAFVRQMADTLDHIHRDVADNAFQGGPPAPLVSLFVNDCIEKAKGYHDRGARYTVMAPHAGGLPDVFNSLYVLKEFVYNEKQISLKEFANILRNNWQGHEELRRQIRSRYELYGNDRSEVDKLAVRVFDDYVRLAGRVTERNGVLRPPGISTFGREIGWRDHRRASPFGNFEGDILATNLSPTPGTDRHGPTSVIRSYCAMNFETLPNGVPLDLKMSPGVLKGETGVQALIALMRTFVKLGGWYLQIDTVDSDLLRDAQKHPEKYPNLSVRISGWSARFATLNKEWQDMIINRTQQKV